MGTCLGTKASHWHTIHPITHRPAHTPAHPTQIGVRQVVMRGTGRITLSPLLDRLPVVGGARVSLMGPPGALAFAVSRLCACRFRLCLSL